MGQTIERETDKVSRTDSLAWNTVIAPWLYPLIMMSQAGLTWEIYKYDQSLSLPALQVVTGAIFIGALAAGVVVDIKTILKTTQCQSLPATMLSNKTHDDVRSVMTSTLTSVGWGILSNPNNLMMTSGDSHLILSNFISGAVLSSGAALMGDALIYADKMDPVVRGVEIMAERTGIKKATEYMLPPLQEISRRVTEPMILFIDEGKQKAQQAANWLSLSVSQLGSWSIYSTETPHANKPTINTDGTLYSYALTD